MAHRRIYIQIPFRSHPTVTRVHMKPRWECSIPLFNKITQFTHIALHYMCTEGITIPDMNYFTSKDFLKLFSGIK